MFVNLGSRFVREFDFDPESVPSLQVLRRLVKQSLATSCVSLLR